MSNAKELNILVIDRGNTFLKVALFQHSILIETRSLRNIEKNEVRKLINELEVAHDLSISHSILSSVIPDNINLIAALKNQTIFTQLNANTSIPIFNHYGTPATLGNDRIAAVVGASNLFPDHNLLVIDAGTCITFDFINREKKYFGGAISPGIGLRFKALNNFTGNLPLIQPKVDPVLIGDSTENSILSGVVNGIRAEVDGIINQYKFKFPEIKVIFTGGDINYFDKYLKNNIFAVENLVLTGLKDILLYNVGNED